MSGWATFDSSKKEDDCNSLTGRVTAAIVSFLARHDARRTLVKYIAAADVGGVLGPDLSANIRAVPLDVEKLWELAQISRKSGTDQTRVLYDFSEDHNHKILDVITTHDASVEVNSK